MTKRTTHEESGHPVGRLGRGVLEGDEGKAPGNGDERFQALIENSADVIALTTADGTILYESPSVERVSGHTPEELMGTSFFDLIHPDDRLAAADNLVQILDKSGASASMELRLRHKNGSWVHVEGIGKNLLQNPDVHSVVFNYRDVTKHKQIEDELRKYRGDLEALVEERTAKLRADIAERGRVEKALRESEEKLNEALRIGRMGSWEYNIESQEVVWSDQLFELMDRDPSLGPPDSAVELTSYYPEDLERLVSSTLRVIETGQTFSMEYYVDLPSGRSAHYLSTFRPVRDPSGRVSKVVGTVQDITERKRMEEELVKTQKLESVGVLAGGIAHDFNNILSCIWGNIDLAKMDIEPRTKAFESLEQAMRACHHATDLTAKLLTFSKGGTPVKQPVSIAKLIRDASDLALSGSNVRCELDLPDDSLTAAVDEGQINQVFHNLILNAIQAMPEGGSIRVRGDKMFSSPHDGLPLKPGEYVRLSIQDHGTGIKKEHLHRIFDPYFTTKQTGSGLGLAVVHSIIDKHDGHVRVESQLGEGTTFHFYLPACAAELLGMKSSQEGIAVGEGRVLLMDDDEMVLSMAGRMLTRLGYDAELAGEGSQVIKLYQEACESGAPFDAVILDLTIRGGMGGLEVMGRLREIDPEVKAIVSSGYSNDPVMADFEAYGFVGVIPKPYEMRSLSEMLKQVVEPSR
jgi:PAS domain S-box-containing protein